MSRLVKFMKYMESNLAPIEVKETGGNPWCLFHLKDLFLVLII